MLSPLVILLAPAAFAGLLGPGIAVHQVVPPEQIVEGVKTLKVDAFSGPNGKGIAAEIVAELANTEREVGMGTAGDVAGKALKMGSKIGGDMLASKLGGGFGGKLAGGMAEGAGNMAADAIAGDKVNLDDGLRIDVFKVSTGSADGKVHGKVATSSKDSKFKKTVTVKDSKGNVVKDKDGNPKKKEIVCDKRTVSATVTWALTAGKEDKASGTSDRSSSSTHCPGDKGKIASVEALTTVVTQGHGTGIVTAFTPSWKNSRIGMKKNPDLRLPLMLIRKTQYQDALCTLHHMVDLVPDDPEMPLNYAAVLESLGHHDESMAAYEAALAIKPKYKIASKGAARVATRKSDVASMTAAYGLEWKIGAAPLAECPAMPEGRPSMAKKGKLELMGAPDGEMLQQLEKGERLFVMETEGKMVKVQLIDGTEGWVSAKGVK
jgi:hypothetical protein